MLHRRCSYFQLGLPVARGDHMLFIISFKPRNCQRVSRVFTWENSHRREFHTARDDFLILYRVYMMTGSFHISLLEGTLHVDKIQNRKHYACATYPFQSTGRPISRRNGWSFCVYMILLWDFVPEWNLAPVQEPGWTHAGVTRACMTFCGGIM